MKTIGLFGGSFNPVHLGHTIVAGAVASSGMVDEIWLLLSPRNPLKTGVSELDDDTFHRLNMLRIAVSEIGNDKIKICDIELSLPVPSYTINTLKTLKEIYPSYNFKLIIGGDNYENFKKWKENETIINEFGLIVYPRAGSNISLLEKENVNIVDAPIIEISSTKIRAGLKEGKSMSHFLTDKVGRYIELNHLYR